LTTDLFVADLGAATTPFHQLATTPKLGSNASSITVPVPTAGTTFSIPFAQQLPLHHFIERKFLL
jgi:hypothetical protein